MIHCTRRRVKFCFCVSWFFLLLIMISLSILSIVEGFKDQRQVLLSSYSKQISLWEKSKRLEFAGLDIIVNDSLNNEAHLVKQEQDPSMLRKDNYTKLKEYSPTFYSISIHNPRELNRSEVLHFNVSIIEKGHVSNLTIPPLKAFKTSRVSVLSRTCKSLGGSYDGFAKCTLKWRLNGFCVKVSKAQDWELDRNWKFVSCGPSQTIGTYQVVQEKDDLGDMTYKVRSASDPLIYARQITRKTVNFGLPKISWEIMGFVMLALSILLISQPAYYFKQRIYGELKESPILVEFQPRKTENQVNLK